MRKVRVGFLNTHPIQYFAPLYAYLNQSEDLAVSALYLSDYSVRGAEDHAFGRLVKWDVDLLSGYEVKFVPGAEKRNEPRSLFSMVAPALWGEIRNSALDALVVYGHYPVAQILGMFVAKGHRVPVFTRGETHLGLQRSRIKARLRRPFMKLLYAGLDGALAIGSANAAFYRAMGVSESRIFLAPYAVDNARFVSAARLSEQERSELRRCFNVADDRPIVLYSAKFDTRKCPGDLLHAAARLNAEGLVFQLVMVGSGTLENDLRRLAETLNLRNAHFHGFINQAMIPKIYGACDIFVLPSRNEPWGLAINEAMCAGLPIVASAEIGCVPDLVRDGVNGRTFSAGDIPGLTAALQPLVVNAKMRCGMGKASLDLISRWSFAETADGLRSALRSVGLAVRPAFAA